jgi:hypothetical protein
MNCPDGQTRLEVEHRYFGFLWTTTRDGEHWLVGEMPVPDWVTKLKRICKQDLVTGEHYLRFDGGFVRQIDFIVGDRIRARDELGSLHLRAGLPPEAASVSCAAGDGAAAGRPVWWRGIFASIASAFRAWKGKITFVVGPSRADWAGG